MTKCNKTYNVPAALPDNHKQRKARDRSINAHLQVSLLYKANSTRNESVV